jgi:outer membrane biosynthesis protein TonB
MQSFPKWKYHRTQPACIVQDEIEEVNLGPGWVDHPSLLNDAPEEAAEPATATFIQAAEPEEEAELEAQQEAPRPKPVAKPKPKAKVKAKQQPEPQPDAE